MKKETIYWLSGTAVLVGLVTYFVSDVLKTAKNGTEAPESAEPSSIKDYASSAVSNITAAITGNASFPLKNGSRGNNVKKLQQWLNSGENAGLTADGIFGTKTENAVKAMQVSSRSNEVKNYVTLFPIVNVPGINGALGISPVDQEQVFSGQVSQKFYNKFIA